MLLLPPAFAQSPLPAFPGAEGFGAASIGGRGGRIIEVTSLANEGPGTLRAALEAAGPRIVVFRTAGIIDLDGDIQIRDPYVTVAGQTAPGSGIVLRKIGPADEPLIRLRDGVHDVIIRYLRLRHGTATPSDNLSVRGSHDIVLDHLSLSWAPDENLQIFRGAQDEPIQNVTLQRSILSEALEIEHLGSDGLGMIVTGDDDRTDPNRPLEAWKQVAKLSIHHNLFAHNRRRNPRVTALEVQIANNVIYNWNSRIGASTRGAKVDHLNNFALVGPILIADVGSDPDFAERRLYRHEDLPGFPAPSLFLSGNVVEPGIFVDPNADNAEIWRRFDGVDLLPLPPSFLRATPIAPAPIPVRVESARDAFESVLDDVGANARLDCEGNWIANADPVDVRVVDEVRTGTGTEAPLSDPEMVGGYPEVDPGMPCPDADHDGMPDAWEDLQGLDPDDPNDGPLDSDGDGYTNVEEYLNGPVEPENGPPTAVVRDPAPAECSGRSGGAIVLDGSSSVDPDSSPGTNDDIEAFEWFLDFGLLTQRFLGEGEMLTTLLPLGSHAVTLRVTDSRGATDAAPVQARVVDTTPPEISVDVTPDVLFPPNGELVQIQASVRATDLCGAADVALDSVTSNEPGSGDDIHGAEPGTPDFSFSLRAERLGRGSGRRYAVTYTATDASLNWSVGTSEVSVPHDRGRRSGPRRQ